MRGGSTRAAASPAPNHPSQIAGMLTHALAAHITPPRGVSRSRKRASAARQAKTCYGLVPIFSSGAILHMTYRLSAGVARRRFR